MHPAASFAVPTKILTLLCALLYVSLANNVILTLFFTLSTFVWLAVQRNLRIIYSFGIFYIVLCCLLMLIRFQGLHMILFSEFYVLMYFNMTPVFIVGWNLITTPPGELSAFLSRIQMPTPVILGLLVMFRFFPTMRTECRGVWQSMRNRGLTAFKQVFLHPAATCEYVLIPLLLRILQIADQLSVSAVARGAQAPQKRSSYYYKPMCLRDWICCISWTAGTCLLLILGGVR